MKKDITFLGDTLKVIREFPDDVRQDAGHQLDKVQNGEQPDDFKPLTTVGAGVEEIRVWDDEGTYRVIYTARIEDMVYVLHAFKKKTQETPKAEIDTAKNRLKEVRALEAAKAKDAKDARKGKK